ncbi:MAG: hypothetical protein ACREQN_08455 [Candidatus Binataceae bacterium]
MAAELNRAILVIGYGSLLSGYGMLAERRGGGSKLIARDAFPVVLENARRGLAKPSTHGHYLAMDLEPARPEQPIMARVARKDANGDATEGAVGALGLEFERQWAPLIARREEYEPSKFIELIALADRAGLTLGEFLLEIAARTRFNLLEYRRELRALLDGYTSPGYIFHPVPLADGRVAIAAIASGFEGSGDPDVVSKRKECGMERLLTLTEALAVTSFDVDYAGQVGYFVECVLGGLHGVSVDDLVSWAGPEGAYAAELKRAFERAFAGERERFMRATSLDSERYARAFDAAPNRHISALLAALAVIQEE